MKEGVKVQTRGMDKDSTEARLVPESSKLLDFLVPIPVSSFLG